MHSNHYIDFGHAKDEGYGADYGVIETTALAKKARCAFDTVEWRSLLASATLFLRCHSLNLNRLRYCGFAFTWLCGSISELSAFVQSDEWTPEL